MDGFRLRSATREIVNELRYARTRAIASGQTRRFEIDPAQRTWMTDVTRHGTWPPALEVRFIGARELQPRSDTGVIVFFADGASSGGRIELGSGTTVIRIEVAWLTGEVRVHKGVAE